MVTDGTTSVMPGPRGWGVVGTLLAVRDDPLRAFIGLRNRWGGLVRLPLGRRSFHLIGHHQAARRVLRDNASNYTKDTFSYGLLRRVLGSGLLTSEGETWRERRRLAQPAFHSSMLASVATTIVDCTDAMVRRWRSEPFIEVGEEMAKLTLEIVSRAILGVDLGDDAEAVGEHLTAILEDLERRTGRFVDWPASWPLPRNRRFRNHVRGLDQIVDRLLAKRRAGDAVGADLAGMLLEGQRSGDHPLSDSDVRDELKTFLVTGHETTANLLTWTLALLGTHPDVERRAREEVDAATAGETPSARHLAGLGYTRMVVKEALRLYPPIWLIERRAAKADVLAGCDVPPGSLVAICQYVLHRDPDVFTEPERFNPDRFTELAERSLPACAYLPFGAGSRACIGGGLAMMEAQLVVARLLQAIQLEPQAHSIPEPLALITLRPGTAVRMRVVARTARPSGSAFNVGVAAPATTTSQAPGRVKQ